MNSQSASKLLLIRPKAFGCNPETRGDNHFQNSAEGGQADHISKKALQEFDTLVEKLGSYDIDTLVFEDTEDPVTPDAVFPNNWLSTHEGGILVTYPMMSPIRRKERREDILKFLETQLGFSRRYGFEYLEDEDIFLEGTGSMVLDRVNKKIYAALSQRTHIEAVEKFAVLMGYSKHVFRANDEAGRAVYHTNVMMSIGRDYVLICPESIEDPEERSSVVQSLQQSGREIINVNQSQMRSFACNCLNVLNRNGDSVTLMSDSAIRSLHPEQIDTIRRFGKLVGLTLPAIEYYGGGSIRCMLAEIFITD